MTTATHRWAFAVLLALAGPLATAQTLGDEFIFFVDGTNVLVPSVEGGQTVADPLDETNTVMRFNAGNWAESGFAWPRTEGIDATGNVGATFADSDTLYFRILSSAGNIGGSVSLMINDVTNDSGLNREDAEANPDDQDYLMRLIWPIPDALHDGQWHDVVLPLPPTTFDALEDAKANDTELDANAALWSYVGAWSLGGFGIGEVGGVDPPTSDPLWSEFQWDQMYRIGPFWDNPDGGEPIYLDDVYIGSSSTSLDGTTAAPTAMSAITAAADGEINTVSWSEVAGVGGYKVYASLDPITDVTADNVVELARIIGSAGNEIEHRIERTHPEFNPPTVYYAVTTLSQFGVENQDVSASSGSVNNDNYAQRPYIRGLTAAEADALFDDISNGNVSDANFPEDHPVFLLDSSHRTITEGTVTPEDTDVSARIMIGFSDQEEWIIYGEVTDDVVVLAPEARPGGDTWMNDSVEIAFGHYDVRLVGSDQLLGSPHFDMQRGDEPDYQVRITGRVDGSDTIVGSSTQIGFSREEDFENATIVEKTDTGWKFLTLVEMDQIQSTTENDVLLPVPGVDEIQLIPFTISINDADADGSRESQIVYSVKSNVTNQWWNTPAQWEVVAVAGRNFMGTAIDDGAEREGFSLAQSVPNPTSGTANIAFTLGAPGEATVEVFNVLGQRVLTVADGTFGAGPNEVTVDTNGLAAGVYVYRLTSADYVATRRLTVAR